MSQGELELLRWLESASSSPGEAAPAKRREARVEIGLGDDLAAVRLSGGGTVLIGSDMLVTGTHFDLHSHSLEEIGRKALLCSLSDCAAMAVRPLAALVSLVLPCGEVLETGKTLLESIIKTAEEYDCQIVGGDTVSWAGALAIDITIAAEPWPDIAPVRRNGARPGDLIYVTGPLGGSLLGKHMSFTPRIQEARELAKVLKTGLHAMIDISDGLSLDLHRVCAASGCGCVIEESRLVQVVSPAAHQLAEQDGRSPLEHALCDGEDYELLLAVGVGTEQSECGSARAEARGSLERMQDLKLELHCIGRFTAEGFHLQKSDGELIDLKPRGYVH